jgi:hypothetical protein
MEYSPSQGRSDRAGARLTGFVAAAGKASGVSVRGARRARRTLSVGGEPQKVTPHHFEVAEHGASISERSRKVK